MNIDLDELETLARSATPGEWTADGQCNIWAGHPELHSNVTLATVYRSKLFEDWQKQAEADAAYIAATNPAVVLALIERLRQAEAALHAIVDRPEGEWIVGTEYALRERHMLRECKAIAREALALTGNKTPST